MNETLKTIKNLHSTHGNFTETLVSDEHLQIIINASVRGANASNRQSYAIIVVRGYENVKRVIGCGYAAPLALVYCVDFNRIYDIGEHLGYESNYDNLFSYLTAHTDAVIAAQTAVIAATSLGLSSLYTNSIHHSRRKDLTTLYEELNLPPEHLFPVTALLLGYQESSYTHITPRLNDLGVVHYDSYSRLSDEQKNQLVNEINTDFVSPTLNSIEKSYLDHYYSSRGGKAKTSSMTAKIDQMLIAKLQSFLHTP